MTRSPPHKQCYDYPVEGGESYSGGTQTSSDHLNAAPWGLGAIAAYDYMGDLGSFYCPSAGVAMPMFYQKNSDRSVTATENFLPPWEDDMEAIGQLGGNEASNLMYGDWSGFSNIGWQTGDGTWNLKALMSQYAYRNTPVMPAFRNSLKIGGSWTGICSNPSYDDTFSVPQTYPQITSNYTSPAFKNQKFLGNRAISSDMFDQDPFGWAGAGNASLGESAVDYCHVDGYNVLYGDGHVQFVEDRPGHLRALTLALENGSQDEFDDVIFVQNMMFNGMQIYEHWTGIKSSQGDGGRQWYGEAIYGYMAWHLFDMAFDIDADDHLNINDVTNEMTRAEGWPTA